MKRIAAVVAVAVAVSLAPAARAEDGKAVFDSKCAMCHGPDGKGKTKVGEKLGAKDLTGIKESEASIAKTIEDGKPPKMSGYKGKLSPEQIQAVAKYVKAGLK
jgi:cytochrome c6